MTFEMREKIFAKDILTIADLEKILSCPYAEAAKQIRNIKKQSDRTGRVGRIHVQDYIDYFKLDIQRYLPANLRAKVSEQ